MILSPGASFGPYRILGLIGSGGMGEVYRALDTRLKRNVALKVLDEQSAGANEVNRFEQEARAASALDHPNIVVVHEIGEAVASGHEKPLHYLTMELLEGESLQAIAVRGALPLKRVLDLGAQIASGLACAHDSGIVHRDLKPSNIVITHDGRAKILDFGVAKLRQDENLETSEDTETAPGIVLGTVGYMSPEQARGEPVTAASDQFALGCILYKMLTGRPAFRRPTQTETLAAILRDEPTPIEEVAPSTPAPLLWLMERCLAKEPSARYASTRDLARDLETLRDHLSSGAGIHAAHVQPPAPRRRRIVGIVAVAAALVGLGVLTALVLKASFSSDQLEFQRLTLRHGFVSRALFVPDSSWVLYSASWDGQTTRTYMTLPESAGLDRPLDSDAQLPMAYSEDGTQVLVLLGSSYSFNARGTLAWWPAQGGKARPILEQAGWADWARKGHFLVAVRHTGTHRVLEVRGPEGDLRRELFRTSGAISSVRLTPDEKTVAFIHHPSPFDNAGEVAAVDIDNPRLRVLSPRFIQCDGLVWNRKNGEFWFTAAQGSEHSFFLFAARSATTVRRLHALPDEFKLQDVNASGDRALLRSVHDEVKLLVRSAGAAPRDLTWFRWNLVTDLSPDATQALMIALGPTDRSSGTWLRPLDGGDAVRLGGVEFARFSPDGRAIVAVTRAAAGPQQLVLVPVGPGPSRPLTAAGNYLYPSFVNDKTILFVRSDGSASDVYRMNLDGGGERPLGAPGCIHPNANASGSHFVCVGGDRANALYVYPMTRGSGRKLLELPPPDRLVVARWNASSDRIFAITRERRFLSLDPATGRILSEELLPGLESGAAQTGVILEGAISGDGSVQAYSLLRFESSLYLLSGLR